RGERTADRAAAARDQHAAAAEALLKLENGGDGIEPFDHGLPVECVRWNPPRDASRLRRRPGKRPLDRAERALPVDGARRVRLVDPGADDGHWPAGRAKDGMEAELAAAVGKPFAEQAVRVRDMGDLRMGPQLLDVAFELKVLRRAETEKSRVHRRERPKERC